MAPTIKHFLFFLHCPFSLGHVLLLVCICMEPQKLVAPIFLSSAPKTIKAITSMQGYMEGAVHLTKLELDPQDDWLPITESRKGNIYYSAFHTLSSGIGAQALVLPLAFVTLGWTWGIVSLSLMFAWQLYTLWLLIQLHESQTGVRYSRYLTLSMAAFGKTLGKLLVLFPTMYLSGGTCVVLIMIGGGTMKLFFKIICVDTCNINPLSTVEWYLVFTCCAIITAQLPNLNSMAGVSLVGAATAISYCTIIWVLSISRGRPEGASYEPLNEKSGIARIFRTLNAVGIIAFVFRGHNLVLEIQGTMPSTLQTPSRKAMWGGVKLAYLAIGLCLFPLALGGYWTYGDLIPANQGMLYALCRYHGHGISKVLLGLISLLIVVKSLASFQIYAMPVFDNLEFRYTSKRNKPCPQWLRSALRLFFGCLAFFVSAAFPFLPSLAGLIGGIALPITLAYPCIMWIIMRKPPRYSAMWLINGVLGASGMVLSVLLVAAEIWSIVKIGIPVHFFKPK